MTALGQLRVAGASPSGGSNDSITVTISGAAYSATGGNYFPDLGSQWQEAEVNTRLREKMVKAFGDVIAMKTRTDAGAKEGSKVSLRIAAYMVAIQRVLRVHELRGMYA